jgi:hypothetical protein
MEAILWVGIIAITYAVAVGRTERRIAKQNRVTPVVLTSVLIATVLTRRHVQAERQTFLD